MSEIQSWQPMASVLVSLLAVPLMVICSHRPNLREFWTIAAAFLKWGFVVSLIPTVLKGHVVTSQLLDIVPGISLKLTADPMGLYFATVASSLWIFTSFYSIGYMRGVGAVNQTRYFACFAICLSATMGIAFAANLVTFIIFYEILSIATYPLVVHKQTPEAIRAGRQYLTYALTAGVVFIFAIIWTYQISGTLDFKAGGFLSSGMGSQKELLMLFILFVAAAGVKAGIMPLHSWLPAAMIAPTPVSALLHAVAVVKAGVFAILRISGFVFGPELMQEIGAWNFLAWISGLTLVIASLLAFQQNEIKKRLAYSTIAHLSYIILGAAMLGMTGWQGGLLHMANHATLKITLFFTAGAIYVKTHRDLVTEFNGIGRQMPFTMGAFALASLGLVGVPPLNGFISKWYLALGTLDKGEPIFFGALLLASLLCGGYLIPIAVRAFFFKPDKESTVVSEAGALVVVPLCLTAIISLILGISPNGLGRLFEMATRVAQAVTGG